MANVTDELTRADTNLMRGSRNLTHLDGIAHPLYPATLGATYLGDGRSRFLVWAPRARSVSVVLLDEASRQVPMVPLERGYHEATVELAPPGTRYFYRLDDQWDRPDPASRFQPEGVHQASAVVDPDFPWEDGAWHGIPLGQYITYELHVGTYSAAGTFEAIVPYLDELLNLGITAIELMPVAQFPGERNWGYDGVHPFAVQNSYGGPHGLKCLVNACHVRGLAVVMDVVYNHVGPEGNYLSEFGPYFTDRHRTPWGAAINYDGADSDEVRRYFIENALYWIREFHMDALRLDAVHAIYDYSAFPFLQELADAVRQEGERLNRRVYTVAESSLNDARLVRSAAQGGLGVDAQWCDDLHHAVHTALTGERHGYYADFLGVADVIKMYRDGFVLDGRYSVFHQRRHGNSALDLDPAQLVVCAQNHDQIGNRMLGERLTELVPFEALKLSAGAVILSPYQPLLFMGEEYGETARFPYFVSHLDAELIAAVRRGRKEEFAQFQWSEEPLDPADEATMQRARLNHDLRHRGTHHALWNFYRELIRLRKSLAALAMADRCRMELLILRPDATFALRRWAADAECVTVFHFGSDTTTVTLPLSSGSWTLLLDSAAECWGGSGSHLPERLAYCGEATLTLAPYSLIVLAKHNPGAGPTHGAV